MLGELGKLGVNDGAKGVREVYTEKAYRRVYPHGAVAGQVIGVMSHDGTGVSGLECEYQDILGGKPGTGTNRIGDTTEGEPPVDGTDIVVSLDLDIQQKAEQQLTQAMADTGSKSGNVVVTDPTTGEVLAIASTPLADLTTAQGQTDASGGIESVTSPYEPGSTFKTIAMAIGFDTGAITENSTFSVPPKVKVGADYVTDDDRRSQTMTMTPYEIMRRSSNTGAALVGQTIGADRFSAGIARFGIGFATGIDLPDESVGLVPQRSEYTGATVGSMAFGQGMSITGIQLVRAVGAIANGGVLTTPHLLIRQGDEASSYPAGARACSEQAAQAVTRDMVGVVQEGTGKAAKVAGHTVAGKTGTGEQAIGADRQATTQGLGYQKGQYLSSFIGFSDADDPKALVYVGMYGTSQHGATAAAPYFSAIMGEALEDLGQAAR